MTLSPIWIIIVVIIVIAFIVLVINRGIRAHQKQVAVGREDLVGKTAIVEIALEPKGVVLIEGERWTAMLEKGRAEAEEEVVVQRVEGLKLRVSKKQ